MSRLFLGLPAPAKLNLFLHVVGRRADGYHLLQSVFRLIDRADTVHLTLRADGRVVREGDLPGVPEDHDLTVRAARLLQAQGFTRVVNLKGGLQAWRAENLPLVKDGGGKNKSGTVKS